MRDERRKYHCGRGPAARPGEDEHEENERGADGPLRIFGMHAVEAALRNPARKLLRIVLTDNAEKRIEKALKARGQRHERVQPRDLDRLLGGEAVHQGAMLEAEPLPEPTLEELADKAMTGGPIVILDQVTDPHNAGAILRSAAAFGATGLVMTRRHSPPLDGAMAKAASGGLEHVPVVLVPNLARALDELGRLAVTKIGLDGEAAATIEQAGLGAPLALIFGAEGRGLRRLTREHCDLLCRIATTGTVASLNVSNAAAIALNAVSLRRPEKAS